MDTFSFTKYGTIATHISNDVADEKQDFVYSMRLQMDEKTMLVNGESIKLMPGMTVVTEIRTGTRRMIEFF